MAKSRKRFRLRVELKKKEIKELRRITSAGVQPVKRFRRARLLLLMNEGKGANEAAKAIGVTEPTARRVGRRYMESGLKDALSDDPRPGPDPLLDVKQSQRIIAMVCGPPPDGFAKWSTSLIAKEAVGRRIVPRVGKETIRLLLLSHDLKPWREKNVVRSGDDQ
jgi:putative transposase